MSSFTEFLSNRWSHIVGGAKKDLIDVVHFLAPVAKELEPLAAEDLQKLTAIALPIVLSGIQSKQKGMDIVHSAGSAMEDQAPALGINLAVTGLNAIANTLLAAHTQAGQAPAP